jgi:putative transcription antitermination factor YqgF
MKIITSRSRYIAGIFQSPKPFQIAAFDVGTKFIGVSVTDPNRLIVNMQPNIHRSTTNRNSKQARAKLQEHVNAFLNKHDVRLLVLGMPIYENQLTWLSNEIIDLFADLQVEKNVPCVFWEESYTTEAARQLFATESRKTKAFEKVADGMAAGLILQSFLRHHKGDQDDEGFGPYNDGIDDSRPLPDE